ncbi:MAG: leucine-rich repeat protein [Oscillospiraceae bacterium]|nr:leucine-rich repeat protein [Oscillospiraceae bacterium]
MSITKKFLSVLTATLCAATASVCSLSVFAEDVSSEMTSGDLSYVQVDEDEDGYFDFIRVTDCSSTAESVLIPKTIDSLAVQEIAADAFDDSTALTSINVDPQNGYFSVDDGILFDKSASTLVCYPSAKAATSYSIPKSVSVIADNAFANCTKMATITIPDSVVSIGKEAFYNCSALAEISIPKSVEYIGANAFSGTELLNFQIKNNMGPLYYADSWVIFCDSSVETVMDASTPIKTGTTGIAGGAFYGCTKLTKIEIPSGVYYIGDAAFASCTNLSSVSIPTTAKTIGSYGFASCSALVELSIPNSVTTIGANAFNWCTKLAEINIPSGVTKIAESTFENCSSLLEINIPTNVEEIEKLAFYNCEKLAKVTINNKNCLIKDNSQTISNADKTFTGTIYGYEGSTAQTYAKKYNILFESLGGAGENPAGMSGDANGDGEVTVRDCAAIAKALAKGAASDLPISADFNGDGEVSVRDAAAIAKHLAGK